MISTSRLIFLLGTHRSGTTILGDVFSKHPDLCYWPEPKHLWSIGNANAENDVLTESFVTPNIRKKIYRSIENYLRINDGKQLVEKTPSNCLRIKFLRELFPNAVFIHLIRDGRSVISSTNEIVKKPLSSRIVLRRAMQIPISQWLVYFPKLIELIKARIIGRPVQFWGPKPPGWREWVAQDPSHIVFAKQWVGTMQCALKDCEDIPEGQYYRLRYEQFVSSPKEHMDSMFEWLELEKSEELLESITDNVHAGNVEKWRSQLDSDVLDDIRPIMEATLTELGYKW